MAKRMLPIVLVLVLASIALPAKGAASSFGIRISNLLEAETVVSPPPPSRAPAKEATPPEVAGFVAAELAPDRPASLTSEDGQLTVQAPPGAATQACVLSISPVAEAPEAPGLTVLSTVFEVTAETPAGEPVQRFAKPIELAFRVPAEHTSAFLPHEVRAFFWHQGLSAWLAVPSEYDPTTGTVRAWVDHLTRFAVMADPGFPALADIRGHWSEASTVALASYKPQGVRVVSGYEDGTFRPDRTVTRQEFVKLAVVGLGLKPEETPQLPFADAESIPEWARGYIAAATSAGLVKGYEDGTFRPFAEISRAEMAVIVARCLSGSGAAESVLRYGDAASIPAWVVRAVALCTERGIFQGYEDGTFRPAATTTRAQAAAVVWRLLEAR